ncbi:MAG: DUF4145 domain-containing protein [Gemmatimonadota bacterium]|nr:DUF4145 domain-containing protein [Gemmatimonadota bacterium]
MIVTKDNNPQAVFDRHYALKCPHCGVQSNISAVSIPRYEFVFRYKPKNIGIVYRCDSCNAPVFLRFEIRHEFGSSRFHIHEQYEEIERPQETFDFEYLPESVAGDFREALICYSSGAYNGFAALCRRTVQSVSTDLGADGGDKVLAQLRDLKEMAHVDDDTFRVLKQVIIDGHDGAHPHLPRLDPQRSAVLLELMKDVLYQVYVRKGKLQEAMALRRAAIQPRDE